MKIKEALRVRDKNLFECSELFLSVVGDSVVFSQDFIVSLDFFGCHRIIWPTAVAMSYQEKNEQYNIQSTDKIHYPNH